MKFNNRFFLALASILLIPNSLYAQQPVVDSDSDGLIEINSIYDLDSMRFEPHGKTFRGSSVGCPSTGCFGYELTRDLDFDTNKNGVLDSGDYNQGQSWVPISTNADFYLDGNSHSIKNFFNTTPVIEGEYYSYGLFASFAPANALTIKNLRLVNPKIIIHGDSIITNGRIKAGLITGNLSESSSVENVVVENALISFRRSSILEPLARHGLIGGIAGDMSETTLRNISFEGEIDVVDSVAHSVGGIAASADTVSATWINTHGKITAPGQAAGIFASTSYIQIFGAYSTVDLISPNATVGGIAGNVKGFVDDSTSFENVYFSGNITAGWGGSLIGLLLVPHTSFELKNSYSNSAININGQIYAQLIGDITPESNVLNLNSYQVVDSEGITLPAKEGSYTESSTLSALQCATNLNSPDCAEPYLLTSWKPYYWNFGSNSELPVLVWPVHYPWVSTDKPNSTGDYESIDRVMRYAPEYACETPIDFQVKEKKSGYIFSAKTHREFDFFNAVEGFRCTSFCKNYEVSFLCGGSNPSWTEWKSNDSPDADAIDFEPKGKNICAGAKANGIRVRAIGSTDVYYGAPQKVRLDLTSGFSCINSDNGGSVANNICKDYEVRMVCNVNSILSNP